MTRTQKIERIKKYRPSLYLRLKRAVPAILESPETANAVEIEIYNDLIKEEAKRDGSNNITFIKNFSF